jgi:hypothetical protein
MLQAAAPASPGLASGAFWLEDSGYRWQYKIEANLNLEDLEDWDFGKDFDVAG